MLKKYLIYVLLCVFMYSCVQDMDFNQKDLIEIKPTYSMPLAYFVINTSSYTMPPIGTSVSLSQKTIKPTFPSENITNVNLNFKIYNSYNRDVTIRLDFINDNGDSFFSSKLTALANKDVEFLKVISPNAFSLSTGVLITVDIAPVTPGEVLVLNPQLKFNSSVTLSLKY